VTIAVGLVGIAVVDRPFQVREAELPPVGHRVVTGGLAVPVEAGGDRLVGEHARRAGPLRGRLGLVAVDAEAVVDVPVREDGGVQQRRRPGPERLVDLRGEERAPGVDEDEAGVGRERAHVGERGDERRAVPDLGELAPLLHRVERRGVDLVVPQPVRELQQLAHAFPLSVLRTGPLGPRSLLRGIPAPRRSLMR
jgi:hypothetical protein